MIRLKICSKCGIEKPLELFKKIKDGKFGSWCKECHSTDTATRTKKDRSLANVNSRKYKKTLRGKVSTQKYKSGDAAQLARKRYNDSALGRAAQARWRYNRVNRDVVSKNTLTLYEWEAILKSQDYRCNICHHSFVPDDLKKRAERDHVIPLMHGGALTKENVQALCRSCNARKSTHYELVKGG